MGIQVVPLNVNAVKQSNLVEIWDPKKKKEMNNWRSICVPQAVRIMTEITLEHMKEHPS